MNHPIKLKNALTDDQINELALALQKKFPVEARPFLRLAEMIGATEKQVLDQVNFWHDDHFLREISAVMEGSRLGHDSALVCGKVPAERMEQAASIIAEHPTVTHLYERDHDYNVWFTIATSPGMSLEDHIDALGQMCGTQFHALRRTETFKIGVAFDIKSMANKTEASAVKVEAGSVILSSTEKEIVRALQTSLPLTARPFADLAQAHGLTEKQILDFLRQNPGKVVRKYVGTLRHRKVGVTYNAMVVWKSAPERQQQEGQILANFPQVSHCYARNTIADFPWGLYSMIHGPDEKSVMGWIGEMAQKLDKKPGDWLSLHSTREFKKCRLCYFLPELDAWHNQHVPAREAV